MKSLQRVFLQATWRSFYAVLHKTMVLLPPSQTHRLSNRDEQEGEFRVGSTGIYTKMSIIRKLHCVDSIEFVEMFFVAGSIP